MPDDSLLVEEFKIALGVEMNNLDLDVWKSSLPVTNGEGGSALGLGDLPASGGMVHSESLPEGSPNTEGWVYEAEFMDHPDFAQLK